MVLRQPVISSMKITEKLHGQCFWLLTVAHGENCFKRPFEDVGAVHVCDRSVQL